MFPRLSPTANRVLMALAVFTFACWALAAAALLTWGTGRAAAWKSVARIAERISPRRHVHVHPRFRAAAAAELASAKGFAYGYTAGEGDRDFAWALIDDDGASVIDSFDGRRRWTTRGAQGPAR